MPRPRRLVAFGALITAALLHAGSALAYCRTAVCTVEGASVHGKVCTPAEPDDCGVALQWPKACVSFALQQDGSRDVSDKAVRTAVLQAFATWRKPACGDGSPSIEVFDFGQVSCDRVEYNQHSGNANIIMFRSLAWPHVGDESEGSTDTIALTTVTYDVEKGSIFDADIEVNEAQNHFTTDTTDIDVDLLSVLTHEAGHFLGLAHSSADGATMFPSYDNGTTTLRDLTDDDVAAICATYPPGRKATGACDALPRHGFSPDCDGLQTEGRCSASPGRGADASPAALVLVALGALGLLAWRSRRAPIVRR